MSRVTSEDRLVTVALGTRPTVLSSPVTVSTGGGVGGSTVTGGGVAGGGVEVTTGGRVARGGGVGAGVEGTVLPSERTMISA